uniref:NADH-ubiquinone oxidoreductase chain 6 n=1 Tax=Downesia tarsata TaxID=2790390 RepID=A0A7T1C5C0_9CUCU|nr:NADH dehydrogenase subunit 6 [Downesia tarsata]QPM99435.1 NADH dehydrogenase subunit 6 [Downesia tarsata]
MSWMIMMIMLSIWMSVTFMFLKHPVTLSFTILIQTMIIALITGSMFMNFWFSYILFLTMIGGLLILFLYMTNVASNEKFKHSKKLLIIWVTLPTLMVFNYLYLNFNIELMYNSKNTTNFYNLITKFYNYPFNLVLMMIMIVLLLTLILAVKISEINKGPLRFKS